MGGSGKVLVNISEGGNDRTAFRIQELAIGRERKWSAGSDGSDARGAGESTKKGLLDAVPDHAVRDHESRHCWKVK